MCREANVGKRSKLDDQSNIHFDRVNCQLLTIRAELGVGSRRHSASARSGKNLGSANGDQGGRVGVLLQLQEIVTYYGAIRILKGVSLHVGEGEVVGLLGGNAAGKSTTMKTILGLVSPRAGTVRFSGQDVTNESPGQRVARGIAAVPEARRLFPSMSVYDNLLMGAYSRRKSRWSEIKKDLASILELFPR